MQIILDPEIKEFFHPPQYFDQAMALSGEIYRKQEGRCTQKIKLGKKFFFIKQHTGVGWREIFKNIFQLRLPVLSAKNEWLAIARLHELAIPTLTIAGYGCRGMDPAHSQSFLITRELPPHVSLEDFCKNWPQKPPVFALKKNLIKEVARIARTLHLHGINHRDFYLCHFLLKKTDDKNAVTLYLIDLHRAAIRRRTPRRWIIKDLAGLYFSSRDIGLRQRDVLRFTKIYHNRSLRYIFNKEWSFWRKVKKRGDQLYQKHQE